MSDRTVRVRLEAITSQFQARMAAAGASTKALESRVSGFHRQVKQADTSAAGITKTLASLSAGEMAVAGAAAVAGAVLLKMAKDGVKAYLDLASEVRKFMRVSGASAEQSSVMIARAHALGVSTDTLSLAMFRLSQNVERNKDELAAHGVEIARDEQGHVDMVGTLDNVAAAWKRAGAGQEANRVSQLAFGRGAVTLLPILAATKERLHQIDEAARGHHQILNDEDIQKAIQYKIAVHEMHEAWTGVERQLGEAVLPLLTNTAKGITEVIDTLDMLGSKLAGAKLGGDTGRLFGGLMKDLPGMKVPAVAYDLLRGHFKGAALDIIPFGNTLNNLFFHHNKEADKAAELEERLRQQFEENEEIIKQYAATLDDLYKGTFGVSDASDKFLTDLASLNTTILEAKNNGDAWATSLDTTSTSGLRNRQMLGQLVQDIAGVAKAYREQNPKATQDEIAQATARYVRQLRNVLDQLGISRTKAKAYYDVLQQITGIDLDMKVTLDVSQALPRLDAVTNKLAYAAMLRDRLEGKERNRNAPVFKAIGEAAQEALFGTAEGAPTDTTSSEGADASSYLQALWEQRMQQVANRFHAGSASLAEYQRALDEQLAKEAPWTDAWVALQEKKAEAAHYWTDAVAAYLKALADKQAKIEDNMYTVGDVATDEYERILERRLAGLERYSDEWTRVWQQIQQLEGDALDAEIAIIQAFERGRLFQRAYDELADQRLSSQYMTSAATLGTGSSTSTSTTYSPTFHVSTLDPALAASTANQKLRDYAAMVS